MNEEKKQKIEAAGWKVGTVEEFLGEDDGPDPNPGAPFEPDWASAPGESIADTLEFLGKSYQDFAKEMNKSPEFIGRLMVGEEHITNELATDIANALQKLAGRTIGQGYRMAKFWMNREEQYRSSLERIKKKKELSQS